MERNRRNNSLFLKMKKISNKQLDDEIWNLDISFYAWIIPRLKRYQEIQTGCPPDLTVRKWNIIINKMIKAFETTERKQNYYQDLNKKDQKIMDDGMQLFAKYIYWLWM